jgi:hypothetical protein
MNYEGGSSRGDPRSALGASAHARIIPRKRTFGTRLCGGAVRAEVLRASRLYPVNYKIVPPGTKNSGASHGG